MTRLVMVRVLLPTCRAPLRITTRVSTSAYATSDGFGILGHFLIVASYEAGFMARSGQFS
jgi:hypothetical protein